MHIGVVIRSERGCDRTLPCIPQTPSYRSHGDLTFNTVAGARSPPRAERLAGPIALAGKVPGEAMPGIGLLRRFRIRLSPVDRAAVTMNRGRGAGSILPFLLDPSDPTSAGIDNQDNCF